MNRFIKNLVISVCLFSFVGVSFAAAAALKADEAAKMTAAAPEKAAVEPKQPRKVLIFTLCNGFKHSSIPLCTETMKTLGEKTGAYTSDESKDMSVFTVKNLKQYDAIIFNNTTKLKFNKGQRKTLMNFVKSGKGIVGIHAATDNFYEWPEAAEMIGGTFYGHPWRSTGGEWAIKIEDPKHPVAAGFQGKDFRIGDEIYRTKQMNLRINARVLVALDMTDKVNQSVSEFRIDDVDIPISWIRDFGKGRVFYCGLGHNHHVYWNTPILKHYLAGIQFALGDLDVDTTPLPLKEIEWQAPDIAPLLDSISAYEDGKDRKALIEIEEIIRSEADNPLAMKVMEKSMTDFLQTDATLAAKRFVCQRLSLMGSLQSLDVLGELLKDSPTADMARLALERIEGKPVDKLFQATLQLDIPTNEKIGIINSIGVRKIEAAAKDLGLLIDSEQDDIAVAAIAALGNIATPKAAAALNAKSEKISQKLKPAFQEALLQCAQRSLTKGDKKTAMSLYKQINATSATGPIKIASFKGMVLSSGDRAGDMIVKALKSDDPALRAQAITLVPTIKNKQSLAKIFNTIGTLDKVSKVQLLTVAADNPSPAAKKAAFTYASDTDENVRIAAVKALAIGNAPAVPVLVDIASKTTGAELQAARQSLYALQGKQVDQAILGSLKSTKDPKVKAELITAAGQRKITSSVDVLVTLANSDDLNVARPAYKSLAIVAKQSDLPKVIDLLVNLKNPALRSEAEKAVASTVVSNKASIAPILSALDSANDPQTKTSLISVLGITGSTDAFKPLRKALNDTDDNVKTAAIRAFSQWPNGTPAAHLLKVSKSSTRQIHKILAFRGFVRTIPLQSDRSANRNINLFEQAMQLAPGSSEKKLVLSTLAHMTNPKSLEMALSYLKDSELNTEATSTIISICSSRARPRTSDASDQQKKQALQKVLKHSTNRSLKDKAIKLLKKY